MRSENARAGEVGERFAAALLASEPVAAARLFSPEGVCLSRDGTEIRGRDQIGALLAQLTGSEHRLSIRLGRTVVGPGGVALCTQLWTRGSRAPHREGFGEESRARLVLGRGGDHWAILIVDPWG